MSLNPNAKSFVFNPNASTFSPGGAGDAQEEQQQEQKQQKQEERNDDVAATTEDVAKLSVSDGDDKSGAADESKETDADAKDAATTADSSSSSSAGAKKEEEEEEEEDTEAQDSGKKKKGSKNKSGSRSATTEDSGSRKASKKVASEFKVHDERDHLNVVFIGHVDAGKSTISGQLLLQTGQVDERTIAKYEKEAKDKNRDSWYLAFIMDTNEEERAKGKTVEVGRAHFDTPTKRYTLLDAPGHKNFVPNMIAGAAQADVAVLIISARRGEFETGFERGGQTREHALLAKTLGVTRLVVAINKMDEQTVEWSQERYTSIRDKLTPFLTKVCKYKPKDIVYVPVSGLTGLNVKDPMEKSICPWYKEGRSMLQVLDRLKPIPRDADGPLRIPIADSYKDMGVVTAMGKIESGTLVRDQTLIMQPTYRTIECVGIELDDGTEVDVAKPGENVNVKLKGIDEDDIHQGFVLADKEDYPPAALKFDAQIVFMELLEHKPLVTAGYTCVLHIHSVIAECQIKKLIAQVDKTGAKKKHPTFVKAGDMVEARIRLRQSICLEPYAVRQQLGRFTLRDEGKTIAIGKVTKLISHKSKREQKEE